MLLTGLLAQAVGHAILVLPVSSVNNSVALILTGSYEEGSDILGSFVEKNRDR